MDMALGFNWCFAPAADDHTTGHRKLPLSRGNRNSPRRLGDSGAGPIVAAREMRRRQAPPPGEPGQVGMPG
jgi:hypothetical protein